MERFSHIVVAVGILSLWVGVCALNLLGALEGVVVARHIGHDRTLVRLRRVDQICANGQCEWENVRARKMEWIVVSGLGQCWTIGAAVLPNKYIRAE